MGIGSRDYVGSASFLASARGNSTAQQSPGEDSSGAPPPPFSAEDLLEHIQNAKEATAQQLAARLQASVEPVTDELKRLESLELVSRAERNDEDHYSLSDYGARALEFARIAKSGM